MMMLNFYNRFWGKRVLRSYQYATLFYIVPFFFLFLLLIDSITFDLTEMFFFVLFLLSMLPCGILGLILSIAGLRISIKMKDPVNKDIGIAEIFTGTGLLLGGLIGAFLIIVITH